MAKSPPYPFVKWAGGKSRMAEAVCRRLPVRIRTYYEPMVGGGAVFIRLARDSRFRKAVIGDVNVELMTAWSQIQSDVEGLIGELRGRRYRYDRDCFMRVREDDPSKLDSIQVAARFIFLNRTCFNGLFRVNRSGKFNTPFGSYSNPVICDEANLRSLSEILKGVKVVTGGFERTVAKAGPGDAVYFDPPYVPVSDTSNFTGYTADGFDAAAHEKLRDVFDGLGRRGVRAVLSNSVAPAAIELYKRHDSDTVTGSRNIGGPARYRGSAGEMIVFTGPLSPDGDGAAPDGRT